MNVREVCSLLKTAKKIVLGYGSSAVPFDKDDMLMMDAYGDYLVSDIEADADGYYEINILVRPVKGGAV